MAGRGVRCSLKCSPSECASEWDGALWNQTANHRWFHSAPPRVRKVAHLVFSNHFKHFRSFGCGSDLATPLDGSVLLRRFLPLIRQVSLQTNENKCF